MYLVFALLLLSLVPRISECSIIHAAIDIGAGGPKLRVAEIDQDKITKILFAKEYPVIFQNYLSKNTDRVLNKEIMSQGIAALQEAMATAKALGAERIVCLGASVFRNAANSTKFVEEIKSQTGLQVHILDQEQEAVLAFEGVLSKMDADPQHLIVWDIGGGGVQWVRKTVEHGYEIDKSEVGSGFFRDFIIENIQNKNIQNCKSPNPISLEEALLAEKQACVLAQETISFTFSPQTQHVGVGSVFARGILPLVSLKNPFTLEDLELITRHLVGKTDADLGGGDFACIEVSNALLVLGFLRGLKVDQMHIIDVNITDGALVYEPFWRPAL